MSFKKILLLLFYRLCLLGRYFKSEGGHFVIAMLFWGRKKIFIYYELWGAFYNRSRIKCSKLPTASLKESFRWRRSCAAVDSCTVAFCGSSSKCHCSGGCPPPATVAQHPCSQNECLWHWNPTFWLSSRLASRWHCYIFNLIKTPMYRLLSFTAKAVNT